MVLDNEVLSGGFALARASPGGNPAVGVDGPRLPEGSKISLDSGAGFMKLTKGEPSELRAEI
jgi:hypothetical protein